MRVRIARPSRASGRAALAIRIRSPGSYGLEATVPPSGASARRARLAPRARAYPDGDEVEKKRQAKKNESRAVKERLGLVDVRRLGRQDIDVIAEAHELIVQVG